MGKSYARHAFGIDKQFNDASVWDKVGLLEKIFAFNEIEVCSFKSEEDGRLVVVQARTPENTTVCLPLRNGTSLSHVQRVAGVPPLTIPSSC
ncbi:MAG: hypothetical protein PHS57_02095 [Alphaproteobacteria bacterium]|nr:hypothetical protein [Alphaproteobacteria bacterium]